jgi:transposase InsO family protein
VVARVAGISRQAMYRRPRRPPRGQRRPLTAIDRAVLEVAHGNPTDGTRMVAALASRQVRGRVNRKRVQRLMREHRLLQRRRWEGRRRRPGFFEVQRPDQVWHLDMTSICVAEHGWCYLNAAIDRRLPRPESQAFIESWFGKLKQRCVWRQEFETLDEAREKIDGYVERYHHRPHSRLAYKTPREVAQTWKDQTDQSIPAA